MNNIATQNVVSRFKVVVFSILSFLSLFSSDLLAQINYTQNWNSVNNSAGWSGWSSTTNAPCEGTRSIRRNVYFTATWETISPNLGASAGTSSTFNYSYKVTNYTGGATPTTFGSFEVQYSNSATGPWTTILLVHLAHHVAYVLIQV